MKEYTIYWWRINDENSELCGEEFFTELENGTLEEHFNYAKSIFPNETLACYGKVSAIEAEMMGLDTY